MNHTSIVNDLKILKEIQPKQEEPVVQSFTPYGNFSMIDDVEVLMKDIYTFLRKFSRIPFGVTPKVLLIAWERFGEIKHAFTDKQYQQEDIQELMSKLLEDVSIFDMLQQHAGNAVTLRGSGGGANTVEGFLTASRQEMQELYSQLKSYKKGFYRRVIPMGSAVLLGRKKDDMEALSVRYKECNLHRSQEFAAHLRLERVELCVEEGNVARHGVSSVDHFQYSDEKVYIAIAGMAFSRKALGNVWILSSLSSSNNGQIVSETKNELYKMMEDFTERMNQELHKQEVLLAAQREQELLAQKQATQEKQVPSPNSVFRQLIEETCGTKVCEEEKQNMEDTMLDLLEICRQKELYCIHNNVDDLFESALNSKLLSINSQHLDKEKQEVKNIAEPTAKHQTRISPCLKNFKVIHKESIIPLNKTPQISLVNAITHDLPTEEPDNSLSMGDKHLFKN
ncbi:hypothetical protein Tco_0366390 [Tanacetum coccineum]